MKKYLIIALIATTIGTSLIGVPQAVSAKTDSSVIAGWVEKEGNWYYLNGDGSMAKDTTVDGWLLDLSGVAHKVLDESNIDWDLTNKLNNSKWMVDEPDYGNSGELKKSAIDISLDRSISNLDVLGKEWRIRSGNKVSYKGGTLTYV